MGWWGGGVVERMVESRAHLDFNKRRFGSTFVQFDHYFIVVVVHHQVHHAQLSMEKRDYKG